MGDVQGDLVLRPGLQKGLLLPGVSVVAGIVIVGGVIAGSAPMAAVLIVGGLFTVSAVLMIGAVLTSRITLSAHELVVQGLFGRHRRPRSAIAEAVRVTIVGANGRSAGESLFLLDTHRDPLIRVSGGAYTREDFDRLVDALGVPCSGPEGPVTAKEFHRMHPGLAPWAERHATLLAFAIVGAVCALIAAAVAFFAVF
ncbi:hypothetical protein FZ103_09730 [Streptomonospora sp. PA3]|uniref:hypothetical protein n=1 Tax=Streptomonospora sp. PA3 TaxID=2607326 RepID=UPI0012DFCB8A|nr:hypothetical protein [Streptomonospora sp. PA3]MUL41450.1 hypothetical protein [Streptomonospora sp. PA3]